MREPCSATIRRRARRIVALLLWASAALLAAPPTCGDETTVSVDRREGSLHVRTPFYTLVVDADNGGRIVSCSFDDAQLTRVAPDGLGGMMAEVHTAGRPFSVVRCEADDDRGFVSLATETPLMRVEKHFEFRADRPWFTVRLLFKNRRPYPLSGDAAPAVQCLVEPRGREAAGQQLYCLDRGIGAEVLSPEGFLGRLHGAGAADDCLRWIAVADPASQRAVGFVIPHAGCQPLLPMRTDDGGMIIGWSCPAIPPGRRLSSDVMVVPLQGFSALAALTPLFAADSLPARSGDTLGVSVHVMPLDRALPSVSLSTRAFGPDGGELAPCDPLLFDLPDPLEHHRGALQTSLKPTEAAWLVHALYSRGREIGRFAVPVSPGESVPPEGAACPSVPLYRPADSPPAQPGALIPATPERQALGFVLWRFDGPGPERELGRLDAVLPRGESRTLFVGLRALRPLEGFRMALVGLDPARTGRSTVPPSAVCIWRIRENGRAGAVMTPLTELDLPQGDVAWLAVSVDSTHLQPGDYAAELVATSGTAMRKIPLGLRVLDQAPVDADTLPIWYLGDRRPEPLGGTILGTLSRHGVRGVTVDASGDALETPATQEPALILRAYMAGGGALAPQRPSPGASLLPQVQPVWVSRAWGAPPGALRAAAAHGYLPAVLCDRLSSLPSGLLSPESTDCFWLVRNGCGPGEVREMIEGGVVGASDVVWLHLNLTGADWRHAALEVRSALWAAAWQGLAGLAVSGPRPTGHVDRQLVLWHILRDARGEAALWRQVRDAARQQAGDTSAMQPERRRRLLLLGTVDALVGPEQQCDLRVAPQKRAFGSVYRVVGPDGDLPALGKFDQARRKVLELLSQAPDTAPVVPWRGLYWGGTPLVEDGDPRCAIVAMEGEAAWKTGLRLQATVLERTGVTVPLTRTFPGTPTGADPLPGLIWVIAGDGDGSSLPDTVRAAVGDRPGARLVTARYRNARVAVLRNGRTLDALLRALRPEPHLYPLAQHVR